MPRNNTRREFMKAALAGSAVGVVGMALPGTTAPAGAQDMMNEQSEAFRNAGINPKELGGRAQTVLGLIEVERLGITSCHEHILWDLTCIFREPDSARDRRLAHQPVELANLYWIRANPHSSVDNLLQTDEQLAISELSHFKDAGGSTIVELTQNGMSRNPIGLARVARATGLNIIMGSGYYIGRSHPQDMDSRTEEDIAQDYCFKSCLAAYGGYGYGHILKNVIPFMRAKGMTEENIYTLLVENAKRFLEFGPAQV